MTSSWRYIIGGDRFSKGRRVDKRRPHGAAYFISHYGTMFVSAGDITACKYMRLAWRPAPRPRLTRHRIMRRYYDFVIADGILWPADIDLYGRSAVEESMMSAGGTSDDIHPLRRDGHLLHFWYR